MLIIILLACGFRCLCQLPFPAGIANTYTLSEKEGYSGFIYSTIQFADNGTIYTCDYEGNVEIHRNNYSVKIDSLKKWGRVTGFKIINESEVWALGYTYIAVLKNDCIKSIISLPQNIINHPFNSTQAVYIFSYEANNLITWIFNGIQLIKKNETRLLSTPNRALFYLNQDDKIWLINQRPPYLDIYAFNNTACSFVYKKSYMNMQWIRAIKDENNFYYSSLDKDKTRDCKIVNGKISITPFTFNSTLDNSYILNNTWTPQILYKFQKGNYYTATMDTALNLKKQIPFVCNDEITTAIKNKSGNLYFGETGNRMLLISPFIKKYPNLFNKTNSASIFSVKEDSAARIWAGSYQGNLAILDKEKSTDLKGNRYKIMNGGAWLNDHMYLNADGMGGLLKYDMNGTVKQVNSNIMGFYSLLSTAKTQFYLGTANYGGIWQTAVKDLEAGKPLWNKIDSSQGIKITNVLTISEDTLGRIWCGHPKSGIAVYHPATNKAQTWRIDKNETHFGAFSSLTDKQGTIWMGSGNGLWYYNDYSKEASPQNCHQINHPLLSSGKLITALTLYDKWLVIAAYDKVLLFDLKSFYENKKTVLRYLNPYEAAFTSFTEQNTMLTAKDSSVWFSTSDMLYQWDIKNWLLLPVYKIKNEVVVISNAKEISLTEGSIVSFAPGFNSFDIHVQYVSPDNMPRYTSAALIKDGDTVLLPEPGLQSIYNIKNIAADNYNFILDVFETDGTTTRYIYPITIKKYLWQLWWFWAVLSAATVGVFFYLYNLKRKKQLAEEKAKTKEAELQSFKNEQEKKLANLHLVTLSSQFRPHFILNALNTIGAQMDDKPEAESVLSRLGESVNLIFNHAQQQKILHPFENEWSLVKNVIHIHTLMYLKKLEVDWPDSSIIEKVKNIQVPLGILQIPVENALLHGLSNKEKGPWNLSIAISEKEKIVVIAITDNGVGRKQSATLSNFTKHGTGTKNQTEIINIINATNNEKISITYKDDVYIDGNVAYGTEVLIEIPKQLNYDNR